MDIRAGFEYIYGEHEGHVCLVVAQLERHPDKPGETHWKTHDQHWFSYPHEIDNMVALVEANESTGLDLYASPALYHERQARKELVKSVQVAWADLDDGKPADWEQRLKEIAGDSALVLASGTEGHYHPYIRLAEPVDRFTSADINKAMKTELGGDHKWQANTLLRPIGSVNHKAEVLGIGPPVRVVAHVEPKGDPLAVESLRRLVAASTNGEAPQAEDEGERLKLVDVKWDSLPQYVRDALKAPHEPDRGNEQAWSAMGQCKKAGLSDDEIYTCISKWHEATLDRSATRGGDKFVRREVANYQVKSRDQEVTNRFKAALYTEARLDDIEELESLIEGQLMMDSLGALIGDTGVGKSFLLIDWSNHIVRGLPWHGHEVRKGPVIYVAAEGGSGYKKRQRAWRKYHKAEMSTDLYYFNTRVNLLDRKEVDGFVEIVKEIQPVMITFDTLSRCTPGSKEATQDFSQVIESLDQIRSVNGACVNVAHHTPLSDTGRSRGGTVLPAGIETEHVLEAEYKGSTRSTLNNTKQKDGELAAPLRITREQVKLDQLDKYGRPLTSCVVLLDAVAPSTPGDMSWTPSPSAIKAYNALRLSETDGGMSTTAWKNVSEVSDATFYRVKNELVENGWVVDLNAADPDKKRPTWHTELSM